MCPHWMSLAKVMTQIQKELEFTTSMRGVGPFDVMLLLRPTWGHVFMLHLGALCLLE